MQGRVAIVTGGGAGIGKACAERFVREGMHVVIDDITREDGEATAGQLGVLFEHGTVADEAHCRRLAELALQRWGRIDVLVANAANRNFSRLIDATEREWDEMLAVNLKGTAFACKAVLPRMIAQGGGAIVLLSSVHWQAGRGEMPLYDATKAGIVSLTKSLAIDHAADGVRVNAVCPGLTITDFHIRKAESEGRSVEQLWKTKIGRLQRPAKPSEIAAVVRFLASDEASYVTGQAVMADGGFSV